MAMTAQASCATWTTTSWSTKLREAKEELFNLRFQVATGQLDNNRRLQTVRRDIARIYTVMRERELAASPRAVRHEWEHEQ